MIKPLSLTILCSSTILMSAAVMAGETHHAHVHGEASMMLAFESGAMEVYFESPAMSLLGFEHAPKTQTQAERIDKVRALLSSPNNVLSTQGSDCSLNSANVSISGPVGEPFAGKKNVSDKAALSLEENSLLEARQHDHHQADELDQDHKSRAKDHSEISVVYEYECVADQAPKFITTKLFEVFPSLEKISVNWVTETQQSEDILRPQSPTIELR